MTQLDDPAQLREPKKLGRKRDHTRDPEILDAALEVLAETGYDGMTIDMVAAKAKAGKATLYRRWASKGELVIEAVACMKQVDPEDVPDTGTLRGDLVAMIKPPAIHDAERKVRVMAGLTSMISRDPELADAAYAAIVEPRAAVNRRLLRRAIDRGEIPAGTDIETVSLISQSMATYRAVMLRKPVDREFLLSVIDGVLMPLLGLTPGTGERRS
ncbi:AcrR family transcriptional regulator [Conyzicola lurida]|uniref:AcrR family transcriptional regulator n=1 Tax=Conyzicola lurida TaxID=1172621 RepID=A0A841ALK4_9MICO|nr:TetR/AcrR family transcriptional regulator [Conyzicola lurida]MBB5842601.1 AcrR family transcriptional regulator [Conyzicola lurida]